MVIIICEKVINVEDNKEQRLSSIIFVASEAEK